MTGSQIVEVKEIVAKNNEIGFFMTDAININLKNNSQTNNQIGIAAHSSEKLTIENDRMFANTLAGVTFVNSNNGVVTMNSITRSGNGIFIDNQRYQQ